MSILGESRHHLKLFTKGIRNVCSWKHFEIFTTVLFIETGHLAFNLLMFCTFYAKKGKLSSELVSFFDKTLPGVLTWGAAPHCWQFLAVFTPKLHYLGRYLLENTLNRNRILRII